MTVLDALTELALRSRLEASSQSAFLLHRLESDPRLAIKLTCLRYSPSPALFNEFRAFPVY